MGAQFSEEFLLGYRAGHRDGFADAGLLMRDAATSHGQALSLARREEQLAHLLSGGELFSAHSPIPAVGNSRGSLSTPSRGPLPRDEVLPGIRGHPGGAKRGGA